MDILIQAMTAKQSGDFTLAKQLLSQALIQNPRNEGAWMLMSEVVDDVKLKRNCLERVLSINPRNEAARLTLSKLNTSPLGPVIRGEREKPIETPNIEKTPPFTPPFTWDGEQNQFLALGDMTYPEEAGEKAAQPPETLPTFDWATDSAEPDKTIDKIFDAVSNPELASQPLPDTDLSWVDKSQLDEQTRSSIIEEFSEQATGFEEPTTPEVEPLPEEQPVIPEEFKVSAEPQLGLDAFTTVEESRADATEPDSLMWDNPKAKTDRLILLGNSSIIYANPKASDVPQILGLFAEKKVKRDLFGQDTHQIKLETIQRLSANPKKSNLKIDYKLDKRKLSHQLTFMNPQVRDEAMHAIHWRLGPGFSQDTQIFSFLDKYASPILMIVIIAALAWGLIRGIPLLKGLSLFQSGFLQVIVLSFEYIVNYVGAFNIMLVAIILGVLCLIWLIVNLGKPSNQVVVQR